jgi:hypothetical protein
MRRVVVRTALLLASWMAPQMLGAQDSTRASPRLCYRGRPAPACDRFVLTEVGYYALAAGTSVTLVVPQSGGEGTPDFSYTTRDIRSQLSWEFGLMANRGTHSAIGATLLLGVGEGGADIGVKGRYRRWLGADGLSLDAGSGIFVGSLDGQTGSSSGVGLTGDIAVNAADYGAVVLRIDVMRAQARTAAAVYSGVRLGSKPALGATGLLAIGLMLVISALANSDS